MTDAKHYCIGNQVITLYLETVTDYVLHILILILQRQSGVGSSVGLRLGKAEEADDE